MKLVAFFNLIRWKNLLLVVYLQVLLKYLVFTSYNISTNLTLIQFIILLISGALITSAGYIINDILDIKTDVINKPQKVIISKHFSIAKAKKIYFLLNTTGLILGIGLSLNIGKPTYSFIFMGTSLLLYYYSKKFKSKPIIGNFIVSFLIAISILILYFFDIDKTVQTNSQQLVIGVVIALSIFAFFLNFNRELVKDIEDVNGDYNLNMKTLPILIGRNRTKIIAIILLLIPVGLLIYIIVISSSNYKLLAVYLLLCTLLPLLFSMIKMRSAKTKKDYTKISLYLKIIMFLGINSLLIFSINQ